MKTSLEQMWWDYNLALNFKNEMLKYGYGYTKDKNILFLDGILYGLKRNISNESFNVLNELLRKTYYRLLVKINKGECFLVDIINNPKQWTLTSIENYPDAWRNSEALIFTTETKCAVFCKSDIESSYKYTDNKWQ